MSEAILKIWIFVAGLCIGSFLNVCIYRLPKKESISNPPRSHCPACGKDIHFYDNIPLVSYLLLRGRCRNCRQPISFRYPVVELLSGLFGLACVMAFGWTLETLIYYVFISALMVITFIDIDHQIIPDVISLPGILVFFAASFAPRRHIGFFKILPDSIETYASLLPLPDMVFNAIIGILLGGGSLYAVAWTYYQLTGKEGMGGGDIKLLAMIGAMLGWEGVLFTIFVGSAAGTLAGVILMIGTRLMDMKLRIPFGPFLSIGAIAYIFFGYPVMYWYVQLARG